jgi:hypothetical protein
VNTSDWLQSTFLYTYPRILVDRRYLFW